MLRNFAPPPPETQTHFLELFCATAKGTTMVGYLRMSADIARADKGTERRSPKINTDNPGNPVVGDFVPMQTTQILNNSTEKEC